MFANLKGENVWTRNQERRKEREGKKRKGRKKSSETRAEYSCNLNSQKQIT